MLEMTFLQFLVALCMGLGALCIYIWSVLSGHFTDVEAAKYRAFEAEVDDER